MGSQNVTKFSDAQMKRIRKVITEYDPDSLQADQLVRSAGITTVGSFAKTSNFVQCLSSQSTAYGLELLISFVETVKENKKPERLAQALQDNYGVSPGAARPIGRIMSNMTEILSVKLSSKGEENDAAPAARTAVTQTLLDVLAKEGPKLDAESSQEDIAKAFRKVRLEEVASLFYTNVITSLVNQSLDAARGRSSPDKVNDLKEEIRQKFAPQLTKIMVTLAKRQGISATALPGNVATPKLLSGIKEQTDEWIMMDEQTSVEPIRQPKKTQKKKKKSQK